MEQYIDKGINNIWKWEWLEREIWGELVGRHIRKLSEKVNTFCTLCNCRKDLSYASPGWKALEQHIRLKIQQDAVQLQKTNANLIIWLFIGTELCMVHILLFSNQCPNMLALDEVEAWKNMFTRGSIVQFLLYLIYHCYQKIGKADYLKFIGNQLNIATVLLFVTSKEREASCIHERLFNISLRHIFK